jgi:putative ABC transport system ATP-binding protein
MSPSPLNNKNILLQAEGIDHSFDYKLFENINLTLSPKETIAIIGASGSGKSTLLNILSSLLSPNSGKIVYNNKEIYSLKKHEILKIRREEFGIIFQAHYLFRGFSAKENLMIAEFLSENDFDIEFLKNLKIDHVLHQGVGELSGGQQQRLSIARVLTKKPKVIFADEPTGNLDKQSAKNVIEALFDYVKKANAGMVIVTHENDIAFKCDKVFNIENFKLVQLKG